MSKSKAQSKQKAAKVPKARSAEPAKKKADMKIQIVFVFIAVHAMSQQVIV